MALASEVPPLYEAPKLHSGLRQCLQTAAICFDMAALQRRGARFRLAALTLARRGIIVIGGAASMEVVATLAETVKRTRDQVSVLPPGSTLPGAILNRDQVRVLKGYKALVESETPVINFRHGDDNGMMDIFHPEHLIPDQKDLLLNCFHEDPIEALAERAFGRPLSATCRNLYVNLGVEDTRFFHCDGERVKVKYFVYLCDVSSLDVGPYCYIKTSHRNASLRRRNQTFNQNHNLNKHECRLLAGRAALPMFGRASDKVVSAQHGVHRGYPLIPSARRVVLVNAYEPSRSKA